MLKSLHFWAIVCVAVAFFSFGWYSAVNFNPDPRQKEIDAAKNKLIIVIGIDETLRGDWKHWGYSHDGSDRWVSLYKTQAEADNARKLALEALRVPCGVRLRLP